MGLGASSPKDQPVQDFYYPTQIQPLVDGAVGSGKTIAITGCTTGLGLELAITSCKLGASKVIMLNRPSARVAAAKERVEAAAAERAGTGGGEGAAADAPWPGTPAEVVVIDCDLMDFESVREACKQVLANVGADGLDILCCNAGIMNVPAKATKDGFDVQMQVNHLSHQIMLKELMPALEAAAADRGEARVVSHASSARFGPALEGKFFGPFTSAEDIGGDSVGVDGGRYIRYHQSKLTNAVFSMALAAKLQAKGSKVKSLTAEPGLTHSPLWKDDQYTRGQNFVMNRYKQSVKDGSLPITFACFDPQGASGDFYVPELTSRLMRGINYAGMATKAFHAGVPDRPDKEEQTASKANQELAWDQTVKVVGPLL